MVALPPEVRDALHRISLGLPVTTSQITEAFMAVSAMPPGAGTDAALAALLTGVMVRGPREDEVAALIGAGLSLDERGDCIAREIAGQRVVAVAGSGKKGFKTLNISTPSAIVASAAGAVVMKMGSFATSSVLGSRNLAIALGIPESRSHVHMETNLRQHRFAFVSIEDSIPVVDAIYGNRFHVINPFSFGLAALTAPICDGTVVYGLSHPGVDVAARVLARHGIDNGVVVASLDAQGFAADEFGLGDHSRLCRITSGRVGDVETYASAALADIAGGSLLRPAPAPDARQAVGRVVEAISGRGDESHVRLLCLNAAVILMAAGVATDIADGCHQARAAIDSGAAYRTLMEVTVASREPQ